VQILGALLSGGAAISIPMATRLIVRDVLEYKWKRRVLERTPDSKVADVARALGTNRPDTRK